MFLPLKISVKLQGGLPLVPEVRRHLPRCIRHPIASRWPSYKPTCKVELPTGIATVDYFISFWTMVECRCSLNSCFFVYQPTCWCRGAPPIHRFSRALPEVSTKMLWCPKDKAHQIQAPWRSEDGSGFIAILKGWNGDDTSTAKTTEKPMINDQRFWVETT